jgi:hypothetical protein
VSDALKPAPFVVGVGRSGTTLLRLMLDAHPDLAIPPETHFVPGISQKLGDDFDRGRFVEILAGHRRWPDFHLESASLRARLDEDEAGEVGMALRAFYMLYAESHGKTRFGDKTPRYLVKMRPIARALPEAAFIHLVRDGRDVALSKADRSGKDSVDSAQVWRERIEKARRQSRRVERYMELRYEDLVADPEPRLREVCDLIELDFDPVMLRYHERAADRLEEMGDARSNEAEVVRTAESRRAAHAMTTRPPEESRIARWRAEMPDSERQAFEAEAGELLAELGYATGPKA